MQQPSKLISIQQQFPTSSIRLVSSLESNISSAIFLLLLVTEALRLVRLAEAPEERMYRREWLAWEVRYWALALAWSQATGAAQAA